jgi:hypothetical protein
MMAREDEVVTLDAEMICHDGKPAAMMMAHLYKEKREAVVAAEINHRTVRVKDDVILRHPHQAAPMAAAVAVADQQNHATLARIRRTRSHTTRVPT